VWVVNQRSNKKRGILAPEKDEMLTEAGFVWEAGVAKKTWEFRYSELLKFKETHGHCNVPVRNPDNPSLGVWVVNQRSNRMRGKLTSEKIQLLTQARFNWQARNIAS
jgi:hypothetical protein